MWNFGSLFFSWLVHLVNLVAVENLKRSKEVLREHASDYFPRSVTALFVKGGQDIAEGTITLTPTHSWF